MKPINLLKLELLYLIYNKDKAWEAFEISPDSGWADSIYDRFNKPILDYQEAIKKLEK